MRKPLLKVMLSLLLTSVGAMAQDGLLVHLKFNETAGEMAHDSSGNGHHATLVGFAGDDNQWEPGLDRGALVLASGEDHLEITGLPDVSSTTWAVWLRKDAEQPYATVFGADFPGAGAGHTLGFAGRSTMTTPRILWHHGSGEHKSIVSDESLYRLAAAGADGTGDELGEWNHLALTYDADSEAIVLYVNGEAKGDDTVGTTPFSVVHIGRRANGSFPFIGALDDLMIFDRALGADEISSLAADKADREPNLEEGLQAHWTFDESEGTEAKDSTDNENHGELFADGDGNFPIWLSDGGKEGGAISFNGANHVEVPDAPSIGADLVGGFSMSAWFKSNVPLGTTGGGSRMLEKGNSFFFLQWAGGGMNFLVKKGGSNVTTVIGDPIDADRWYHITGVFDGEEIRVYLDGRLKGSALIGTDIDDAGLPLRIGSDDGSAHFDGAMDDVRMWNRPLTALEVKLLSGVGVTGPPVFVQQPNSETRVLGNFVTLSTETDGQIPMTYQWFKGDDPIAGATGSSLTLRDLSETDAGSYTVVATNSEGEATSDAAVLSVNTIKNPELLVHLLLDEKEGLAAADGSGNEFNGTLEDFGSADANWIEGHMDGGLQLDGEYVSVSDLPDVTSTTWAAWVRLDKEANYSTAIAATFEGAGAGHTFGFHANDNVRKPRVLWNHKNGHVSLMSPDPVELGEWNHLAVTYDADSEAIVLYVNGEAKADGTVGTTPFSELHLGQRASTMNYPFNGGLDHVAIYNRALSSDEIGQLVNKDSVDDGLLLLWNMNETTGVTLADTSGGNANWIEGHMDGGLQLDGEYVSVSDLPDVTSTTWAAWVRLDKEANYSTAIAATFEGAGAGHTFGFHANDNVRKPRVLWNHKNGHVSLMSPDPVELGEWNHLAVTYDADSEAIVLYVNGEAKADGTVGTTPFSELHLGQRASTMNYPFNGGLDHVAIYNRALSSDEIGQLVNKDSVDEGLLVLWDMNETTGMTLADTAGGNANWIEGQMEGGLQLDGEYVSVSDLPDVTSTTWAAWARLDAEANYSTAIAATFEGAGAGHTFGFHANDNVRKPRVLWNHKNGHVSLMSPDPVELGEWNHLAVTYDADSEAIVLYVNGEAKADGTVGTTPFSELHLGQRASTMNYPFNGGLDHVAIYNRALSSDEIGQLVNKDSVDEGLLVLWDMNETTGMTLADSSGNGHDAVFHTGQPGYDGVFHTKQSSYDGIFHAVQSGFWVDGTKDGGLDLTPKSYVSVSGLPEVISTTWTVWVNLQSKPSYGTAISAGFPGAGAGHSLGFHTGDTAFHPRVLWNHALGHTSILSPDPVKLNEWVHLAVSYDGEAAEGEQNLVLYVNGEEKASGAAKTTPFTSINLGQRESSKNAWIDAILDDARIYGKVLESWEITELYGSRTTGPPKSPVTPSHEPFTQVKTPFSV